ILNWRKLVEIRSPSNTVALCDAGIKDNKEPTLATHCFPPSATTTTNIGRPNPRHPAASVSVGFVDGHAATVAMAPPFYPGLPGEWTGNDITDPGHADYHDQMWDLH